jgi:N-acetylmuramoyl-L-alanine amidase
MAVPLLRETRMPVVIVEPAFITNPSEEALLKDKAFLEKTASSIVEGILKYFAGIRARTEENI